MKKTIITLLLLLSIPMYASASVADSSTTTNFTVEVVEESLGLNISGSTDLGQISRKSAPEIRFPSLKVSNHGAVKGYLYAEVGQLQGISFGNGEGDLIAVSIVNGNNELAAISQSENLLTDVMRELNSDSDPSGISPGEELTSFNVVFSVKDRLPVGQLSMPVKWTLKPQ
ncbi:hypothetical protein [Brevibacillus sp. 179-C9.3 HS]|uniref:hypothetical protein n=1 Tax=unclassified Brevibacillus TaxID=2684853 RepID=UPI00399F65F6